MNTQASDATGPLRQAASGKGVDGKQTSAPKNETKNAGYDEATQVSRSLGPHIVQALLAYSSL
jgi:hypothetical protein